MRHRASCTSCCPLHYTSTFAGQHDLGDVHSIHTRVCPRVIQSRAVRVLANCFQESEANVRSTLEEDDILTFGIRPYQFIASAMNDQSSNNLFVWI